MTPSDPQHEETQSGHPRPQSGPLRMPSLKLVLTIGAGIVVLGGLYIAGLYGDAAKTVRAEKAYQAAHPPYVPPPPAPVIVVPESVVSDKPPT